MSVNLSKHSVQLTMPFDMQQLPTAAPEVVRSPQSPELDLAAPADVRDTSGFSNYTLMSP